MERPPIDPSKILAQRYNPANLRIQLRLAENLVAGLSEFEGEWNKFVDAMHQIIKVCEEGHVAPWDREELDELLKKVEAIRLDLASRQHIVLPEFRDPVAKFLRTSVRTYSDALWSLIGEVVTQRDGTILVPIEDDGELIYNVSLKNFEINVGEARAEIARRRRVLNDEVNKLSIVLEEAQRAQDEAHKLDLEKIQAVKLIPLVWARLKESTIGKIVWWFGEEPLRKWLLPLVVAGAAAAIPSIRHGIAAVVQWFLARF
jgi:hypothetical protein